MSDATPAYRGYRLQALYILYRILSETRENITFYPEGIEDLDIRDSDDAILEAIQVKSYISLTLSDLGSEKREKPFFQRAVTVLKNNNSARSSVVNFGEIGPEIETAWKHKSDIEKSERKSVANKLQEKHGIEQSDVALIFEGVEFIPIDEAELQQEVLELIPLFLRKQGAILFTVDISHANRGRFYYQNGQNSTFPNK